MSVTYEVVPTALELASTSGAANFEAHQPQFPLTTDNFLQLQKMPFVPETVSKPIQVTSVCIAVDLLPDTEQAMLGNIAAANWILGADFASLQEAIKQAGTVLYE